MPCPCDALISAQPKPSPIAVPERRAEQCDQHRLPAHRRPHLRPAHADRPQQPELTGALEDRERQRVRDAEQCDHQRHGQQHVDQVQDLVDLVGDRTLELVLRPQRRVRVVLQHPVDRVPGLAHRHTRRVGHQHDVVDVRRRRWRRTPGSRSAYEPSGSLRAVHRHHRAACCSPVSANVHRHRVADLELCFFGRRRPARQRRARRAA